MIDPDLLRDVEHAKAGPSFARKEDTLQDFTLRSFDDPDRIVSG
jgi:hypothetical protein